MPPNMSLRCYTTGSPVRETVLDCPHEDEGEEQTTAPAESVLTSSHEATSNRNAEATQTVQLSDSSSELSDPPSELSSFEVTIALKSSPSIASPPARRTRAGRIVGYKQNLCAENVNPN